jgi:hypothetical protein
MNIPVHRPKPMPDGPCSNAEATANAVKELRAFADALEAAPEKLLSFQLHLDPYGPGVRRHTVSVSMMAERQTL